MNNKIDLQRLLGALGLGGILPEQILYKDASMVHLESRQVLFHKNDPVDKIYLVLYGSLRMQSLPLAQSDAVIYAFKRAGCLLGIFTYLESSHQHSATAVSMENTALLAIPSPVFMNEVVRSPRLRDEVHRQIALNFKELQSDREMQRAPTAVRLAHFLKRTLDDQNQFQSRSILMKLTKKDLAKKIGAEPETIVRLLSEWTRKGIIKNQNRTIEICQLDVLERMARKTMVL